MVTLKDQGYDELGPDSQTYLAVIRTWGNSNSPDNGKRAESWLHKLCQDHQTGASSTILLQCYNAVLSIYARLSDPVSATRVFHHLNQRISEEAGSTAKLGANTGVKLRASSETYSMIFRSWLYLAERGSLPAFKQLVQVLETVEAADQTKESGVLASVELYSEILRVARNCAPSYPEVLDMSVSVFDRLRASRHAVQPIHFSRLLQIGLVALSRPENDEVRTAFVRQLTRECRDAGYISSAYLQALASGPVYRSGWTRFSSERLTLELFPSWPLPPSWMRNIKQDGFIPQREDLHRSFFATLDHGSVAYPVHNHDSS
jgi:hypothetical protein